MDFEKLPDSEIAVMYLNCLDEWEDSIFDNAIDHRDVEQREYVLDQLWGIILERKIHLPSYEPNAD